MYSPGLRSSRVSFELDAPSILYAKLTDPTGPVIDAGDPGELVSRNDLPDMEAEILEDTLASATGET